MTGAQPLVLTPGMGIGPEVSVRALEQLGTDEVVLVGRGSLLREVPTSLEYVEIASLDERPRSPGKIGLIDPGDEGEACEVASIRLGAELCLEGRASGLVTGPIHKARLRARGFSFSGHTDFLGDICGVRPVMGFVGGSLRVVLVTTHIPLSEVPAAITRERVRDTVRTAVKSLRRDLGMASPRVGVCGLNPHAGEQGLLGYEDLEQIAPAVEDLRGEGLDCRGPLGAESAFLAAGAGQLDLVVAMYHDQGLAPLKAVDFGRSVNWSMGLPILRVSVDHGTADALVGTGRADPSSMVSAIQLARQILSHRRNRKGQPPEA
jgi:4-hydroxythreonine-4-phosphate dehydrogenase